MPGKTVGIRDALRRLSDRVAPVALSDGTGRARADARGALAMGPLGIGSWLMARDGGDALASMSYLACELAKARPVSMLPLHVYVNGDGGREEDRSPIAFRLSNLLTTRWNPTLKANNGLQWAMLAKDTLGTAYVRVEWGRQGDWQVPVALWPLTGRVTRLWDGSERSISYDYSGDDLTPPGRYLDREVIALRSPLADVPGLGARSLAEAVADAVGLDVDLYRFYERLITNGTHMPRWIETDERMTAKDREEFAASIEETAGLPSAGYMRIFDRGLKLKQSELSIVDISYLEEARWVLQTVCRICGVPPNEVYDNSQLTYSGNVEMSAIQFASKTLMPECREIESAFDCVLRAGGLFESHVKLDINGLLRGQYESRMKGYQIGIFTGFFSVDEVRAWEELPKVPGGDRRMWPTNYYQVGEDGGLLPPPKALPEGGGAPGSAGDMPSLPDKALAEASFHEPMLARVRERVADAGDTPQTREFAAKVLAPWAHFCARAGIPYDFESEMEGLMQR